MILIGHNHRDIYIYDTRLITHPTNIKHHLESMVAVEIKPIYGTIQGE